MDEKQRKDLEAALSGLSQEKLDEIHGSAQRALHSLEDLNSAFPATREFLEARGLTNVRELDKRGLAELRTHLEGILKGLSKGNA